MASKVRMPKMRRLQEYAFITHKKGGKVKTVRKHYGKVSKNPLLMAVGNPGKILSVDRKAEAKYTQKQIKHLEWFMSKPGARTPYNEKLMKQLKYKESKLSSNPLLMTVGNPCGSKKNPLYAKVGKYGSKATRGFKRSFESKLSYPTRKEIYDLREEDRRTGKGGSFSQRASKEMDSLQERFVSGSRRGKYARNEAGIKPLVAGTRTVTMPIEKFEQIIYAKGTPSEISRYEAQIRAYTKAHLGTPPATITRKVVDVGISRKITDRDFTYSMGVTPMSTYIVPKKSGKAQQSINWKHDWTGGEKSMPHQEVFPGGKVIINQTRRGKKLVKDGWMV